MMQGTSSLITIDSKLSAEAKASSDNNTKKIQMKKILNPIDASEYLLSAACRIALPRHPSLPHSTTH